ncbi:transposase [Aneurinibacillus thermoaerophilus]|uniref:IS91 family transposase n=1 Tax=Aneurinibacillus thermoaerophilus TaxID=143495 RepID=UPI000B88D62F|nr:transposase [Aneurinibacillus thermoaerophilus]MED0676028.1 transposase [Aneurinibacillus thermoaerophilus]MED0681085.1 transposase [Aneurinibacillus thermoaerophilus]MED0736311.1 transposase [Aneurinibacillus thermoaerophilus]MED0758034.1 transposase [Aneurinibacillus thermoaerophilus]MED0759495.1 transposase [Aneurinibacillus thermoaerophilus]
METNILKRIFFDERQHWKRFVEKYGNRIRPNVIKEIEKFRTCGTSENGFKLFVCEGCHHVRKMTFRCKGRFCTSCSNGETEEWGRLLAEDMFQVCHRHVIFTIDEGLRNIFLQHREMLKPFMDEAVKLVQGWFKKKFRVTPGIIAGLHTFGSRLNFNPHVHMLVTMRGMKENGEWKVYNYIPFSMLRKQWQVVVLKLIRRTVSEIEKKKIQPLLQKAYSANAEGFYVYAPKQKGNVKEQLKYIGRYIRRPAIALHRIEEYDGEFVTFRYYDKKEQKEKRETISVEEFISRLIRHIPDEQFKVIRHYGVYSRKLKAMCKRLVSVWQKEVRKWIVNVRKILRRRTWRERIKEGTGKDPMICPRCQCYYEYKGEVWLHGGELKVRYAVDDMARRYLTREIEHGKVKEEKTQEARRNHRISISSSEKQGQLRLFGVQ